MSFFGCMYGDFLQTLWACICMPELVRIYVSIGFFLFALFVFWALLALLRRLFHHKERVARKLVDALRLPILIFSLEIAAVASVSILGLHEQLRQACDRVVVVLIVATLGWISATIARVVFRHGIARVEKDITDVNRRSTFTQLLFLYRLVMFIIVALTLAGIMMTFPYIRSVGVGILGSAGIAGIALGIAARPILLNVIAGFQVAFTKTVKINDAVLVEGDFARIESIHLTHVIACTWDLRRIVLPTSYFIDKPFENWDATNPELLGVVFLYCDYSVPVEEVRKKAGEIIEASEFWNGNVWKLHVTDLKESTMQMRIIMTAKDAVEAFQLRAEVREKLMEYLKEAYPQAFPCIRIREYSGEHR